MSDYSPTPAVPERYESLARRSARVTGSDPCPTALEHRGMNVPVVPTAAGGRRLTRNLARCPRTADQERPPLSLIAERMRGSSHAHFG